MKSKKLKFVFLNGLKRRFLRYNCMVFDSSNHSLVVVGGKISAIEPFCKLILAKLEDKGYSEEDIFAIHLAMEEAFVNAVNHGNKKDPEKEVKIEYVMGEDKTEIFVSDQGQGFDSNEIPDPRCGDNLYKPGGRGIFLMKAFMDSVEYENNGTRVHMTKKRSKQS